MKKISLNLAGVSEAVIVAPGIWAVDGEHAFFILNQSYPNEDQDDHCGFNILKVADNTVSIQQFNTFASEFAAGEGSFANYRDVQAALDAIDNGTVTYGTIIQQQLG